MCKSTYESLSSRPLGSRSAGGENELSWVSDYAIAPALRQAKRVCTQFASVLHALALLFGVASWRLRVSTGRQRCGSTLIGARRRGRVKPFDALAPAVC